MSDRHQRFRDLHRAEGCFLMPNAWDAGSAMALAHAGFPALGTTSAGLAFALGKRDQAAAIGLDTALANIRAVAEASAAPVSADFENGYADDPEGVADAIRACAEAGASGASIEDYAGQPADGLYDEGLAVARIEAAVAAARGLDRPFTLTARCESYLIGLPDAAEVALARLARYAAAGADCVYAPGMRDRGEIERLVGETGAPLNVLVGTTRMEATLDEMRALGVRRLSIGGSLARLGWQAVFDGIEEMIDGRFTFAERAATEPSIMRRFGLDAD